MAGASAGAINAAAGFVDSGVAANNVAASSSKLQGTTPMSSRLDRSDNGVQPISSFLDLEGVDFPPIRTGFVKGVFGKVSGETMAIPFGSIRFRVLVDLLRM